MSESSILIVDDEIIIARELENRLTSMGYDVPAIASTGQEAIALTERHRPDLVLMDIVIKGEMDGIDAAGEIRRRFQTPVIFLTAYADEKTLERAKVTEPFGYIVKPFSERELRANIEMALYKHRTDRTLRKIEQWFLKALDHVDEGVISADGNGQITGFNHGAVAVTAWPKHEAMQRRVHEVIRFLEQESEDALAPENFGGTPWLRVEESNILLNRNGQQITVDTTTIPIRDEENRTTGTVNVIRDATGQPRGPLAALNADVSHAISESLTLRGMLQFSVDSMVRNLNIVSASVWLPTPDRSQLVRKAVAGTRVLRHDALEKVNIQSHPLGRIFSDNAPKVENDILLLPETNRNWIADERVIAFAGIPLLAEGTHHGIVAVFAYDHLSAATIHALEAAGRSLAVGVGRRQLESQLQHSQKLDAVGQLAGGVAHDFNNMLTIILGYASTILQADDLSEETRSAAEEIRDASLRASTLTRQLLTFSRREFHEPVSVDLNALVRETERMIGRLIGEDIRIDTALEPDLPRVKADPGQLEQVLANLSVNARDAMPNGGTLRIATRAATKDDVIPIPGEHPAPDDFVVLTVTDDGVGMPQEVLERAFEPFFSTKGLHEGTGLGLSTVYGTVTQSGGAITIDSEMGEGTTVTIFLSKHTNGTAAARATHEAQRRPTKGTETVLVVEDESAVRRILERMLASHGYKVVTASSVDQAIDRVAEADPSIELVITDVVMPGRSGRELVEELARIRPEIKVLYITGYTEDAVLRRGIRTSDVQLIQKPFDQDDLVAKVREVLDRPASTG